MSKAILILDEMPLNCDKCPCQYDGEYCTIERSETHQAFWHYKRPKWCPLKYLPDAYDMSVEQFKYDRYCKGWNDCLDEIVKGI